MNVAVTITFTINEEVVLKFKKLALKIEHE